MTSIAFNKSFNVSSSMYTVPEGKRLVCKIAHVGPRIEESDPLGTTLVRMGEINVPIDTTYDMNTIYVLAPLQIISAIGPSNETVGICGFINDETLVDKIIYPTPAPTEPPTEAPTSPPTGGGGNTPTESPTSPPIDGGGGDDADTDTDGADPGESDGDDDLDDDGADEGDGGDYVDMGDGVNKLYPKSMQVFNAKQPVVIRSQLPIGMDTAVFYASVSCHAPRFTVNNQPGVYMAIDTLTVGATELFHVPSLIGGDSMSVATLVYMLGPEFINNRPEFEITITGKDPVIIYQISGALVFSKSGFTPVGG